MLASNQFCVNLYLCVVNYFSFLSHLLNLSCVFCWQILADYCVKFTAGHMKDVMSSEGFNDMKSDVAHKFMRSLLSMTSSRHRNKFSICWSVWCGDS